jgi:hypothetical protein
MRNHLLEVIVARQNFQSLSIISSYSSNLIGGVMVSVHRLEYGRSWVSVPIGSNQRLENWYLLLLR